MEDIFKAILRLYAIQLAAILAVWLGMYYPGLDVALALLYVLVLWWEARDKKFAWWQRILIIILWQLPAWFLSASVLLGLDQADDFSYYYIFMLQLWHTPLLPLTTVLPHGPLLARPLYYYEMFLMAPLLAGIYLLAPVVKKGRFAFHVKH